LRKATTWDEKMLFEWANDPIARKSSFNKTLITLDEHHRWFQSKLNDSNNLIWIFEIDRSSTGFVRLEKNSSDILLSYFIMAESRGKGLAATMLKMAIVETHTYWQDVVFVAHCLPENIASRRALEGAGFYLDDSILGPNVVYVKK
jgi:RimJ/RimL family protein N-acetyltransferase